MSAALESVWAKLHADPAFCAHFIADPVAALAPLPLSDAQRQQLLQVNGDALRLAARSCQRKRGQRGESKVTPPW